MASERDESREVHPRFQVIIESPVIRAIHQVIRGLAQQLPHPLNDIAKEFLSMSPVTLAYLRAEQDFGARKRFLNAVERSNEPLKMGKFKGAPRITPHELGERPVRTITPDTPVTIGTLQVKAWEVDHSIAGGLAFLVTDRADGTTFAYASDFRFHGPRGDQTRAFQDALSKLEPPVDALACEGTRMDEDTAVPESQVAQELTRIFKETKGIAVVSFPWKNVYRYQSMLSAARAAGRTLAISPKLAYLAHKVAQVAPDLGIETVGGKSDLKVLVSRAYSGLYHPYDYSYRGNTYQAGIEAEWNLDDPENKRRSLLFFDNGIFPWDIREHPEKYVLHLGYYDSNDLVDLAPPGGFRDAKFIESAADAEDLEEAPQEQRFRNWLEKFGILRPGEAITYVHGSGHAAGPEIRALLAAARPRMVFPIHTEHPELYAQGTLYRVTADLSAGDCYRITHGTGAAPVADFVLAGPAWEPVPSLKAEALDKGTPAPASLLTQKALPSLAKQPAVVPEFDAFLALGIQHLRAGTLIEAIDSLEKAVALDPKRADAWQKLGEARSRNSDTVKAEQAFQRWAELDFEAKLAGEPTSSVKKRAAKKRAKKPAKGQ